MVLARGVRQIASLSLGIFTITSFISLSLIASSRAALDTVSTDPPVTLHPVWGDMSTFWEPFKFGSSVAPAAEGGPTYLDEWFDDRQMEGMSRGETQRLRMMQEQPTMYPKFTEDGYKKIRVPDALMAAIVEQYGTLKHQTKPEGWDEFNIYTNKWEAKTTVVDIGEYMRQRVSKELQPVLEEWSGVPLEFTALYGFRLYHNNSRLANHVDRPDTHIISAIINVDQSVDEPWPLYMKANDGSVKAVYMEPGDLVLYESATCAHGRPNPLKGDYYANFFLHYKPAVQIPPPSAEEENAAAEEL